MIKDSGTRREFETGAVRDIQEGKGRCDLLPLDIVGRILTYDEHEGSRSHDDGFVLRKLAEYQATGTIQPLREALMIFIGVSNWLNTPELLLEVSKHFEEGAKKYGEYNWQKGIPTHCYIDSAVRHYLKWLRGDDDEPHDRAFVWNILCCMWTHVNKPELRDYPRKVEENNG